MHYEHALGLEKSHQQPDTPRIHAAVLPAEQRRIDKVNPGCFQPVPLSDPRSTREFELEDVGRAKIDAAAVTRRS